MELKGKTALVTGGARRIGRAISRELARAGASVAVHYGRSREEAAALAEAIRGMGLRAEAVGADLAEPAQIEAMFAELRRAFGRLDMLVNCAAVYDRTLIDALTAEEWDAEMDVNARAAALCIRHALGLMSEGGAIVNITDSPAGRGLPGYPAYCASKGAMLALTKSAARALAGRGIRVNAVAPGAVLWQTDITEEQKAKVLAQVPMRRAGTPEDVAAAVAFLLRQDYITGQELRVDGGWHMG